MFFTYKGKAISHDLFSYRTGREDKGPCHHWLIYDQPSELGRNSAPKFPRNPQCQATGIVGPPMM